MRQFISITACVLFLSSSNIAFADISCGAHYYVDRMQRRSILHLGHGQRQKPQTEMQKERVICRV
jgi:hypothetical protein